MKLLFLATEFPPGPGGLGAHAYNVCEELVGHGWSVEVIANQDFASEREISGFQNACSYPIWRVTAGRTRLERSVRRCALFLRCARRFQPDLVVVSGKKAVWTAALFKKWYGGPMVAVGHGSEFGLNGRCDRWMNRAAFRRAAVIVCVSEFTRGFMEASGVGGNRVCVIPNGANEREFFPISQERRSAIRGALKASEGPVILTVGNLTERKGQEVVIRALPAIRRVFPGVQYWMIGLSDLRGKLEAVAREAGVDEHVRFLGRLGRVEINEHLNACDIFAMTSRVTETGDCEGFGIAVVEAALCRKPAIVSKMCGLTEAIEDGTTGLAVAQNDPSATAQGVIELWRDRKRYAAMGDAAYKRAIENQTWGRRGEEYCRVFLEAAVRTG